MAMTGYNPTAPPTKRPPTVPGQPTEKPEPEVPPLGPGPGDKPDPTNPISPGTFEKPDTPQWGYGGTGNPDAMTNANLGGGGNPAATTNGQNLGGGGYDGSGINPQATTNTGIALGNPTDPQIPTATAPNPADPFAAMGGGVNIGGNWFPPDNPAAIAARGAATAAPGAPGTPPATTAPVTPPAPGMPPAPPEAPNPLNSAFKDSLLKMLSDNQQAPSIEDPALKGQADAFAVGQTRSTQTARSAMAERAAAQGGSGVDSEVFDQGLSGLYQQQGEAQGSFNAGLVGNELQQRRAQLMSAAALAGNQLTSEQQMALQKQLAETDAAIKREGLAQQGGQFGQTLSEQQRQSGIDEQLKRLGITSQTQLGQGDLDLRRMLGSGQLSLGLLQALMQNQQHGQTLGANVGMFNSGQNQAALLAMLNGLGG